MHPDVLPCASHASLYAMCHSLESIVQLLALACAQGFYGDQCGSPCQCTNISQCDPVTGSCTCQTGFAGPTCHAPCPEGSYGLRCASTCQCFDAGTESCDPVNGLCDCTETWRGAFCDIRGKKKVKSCLTCWECFLCHLLVTPPPPTLPVSSFQVWWAIVGVVAAVFAAVGVAVILVVIVMWKKRKGRKVLAIELQDIALLYTNNDVYSLIPMSYETSTNEITL